MKVAKLIFAIFLISIVLFSAFMIPIIYIYQSGKNFIEEIQLQTKNRAMEITLALDSMSGESIYYDNMISLSNIMSRIMENNNSKLDPYKIKEIFLLNEKDQIIAHNEIVKVAKDFQPYLDPQKYKLKTVLFSGNPIKLEIIGKAKIEYPEIVKKINLFVKPLFNIEEKIQNWIENSIPEILANEFHVYTSVYPPDEVLPKGSLHLIIENQGIGPLISYWIRDMLFVFALSFSIGILLFFSFVVLLFMLLLKNKQKQIFDFKKYKDVEKIPEEVKQEETQVEQIQQITEDKNDINQAEVIFLEDYRKTNQPKEKKITIKRINNEYESIMDAQPLE